MGFSRLCIPSWIHVLWAYPLNNQVLFRRPTPSPLELFSKNCVSNIILGILSMPLHWHHYFKKCQFSARLYVSYILIYYSKCSFLISLSHIWKLHVLQNLLTLVWILPTSSEHLFIFFFPGLLLILFISLFCLVLSIVGLGTYIFLILIKFSLPMYKKYACSIIIRINEII